MWKAGEPLAIDKWFTKTDFHAEYALNMMDVGLNIVFVSRSPPAPNDTPWPVEKSILSFKTHTTYMKMSPPFPQSHKEMKNKDNRWIIDINEV